MQAIVHHPFRPSQFFHSNNIKLRVRLMILLNMRFNLSSLQFLSRMKYSHTLYQNMQFKLTISFISHVNKQSGEKIHYLHARSRIKERKVT